MQKKILHLVFVVLILAALPLSGCGNKDNRSDSPRTFTIGVLLRTGGLSPAIDGLKAGMTELGYTEGENITYLYDGPTGTLDALQPEAEQLRSQNPDLIFALGNTTVRTAQEVFGDTDVPIVFTLVFDPVRDGLVTNLRSPEGNTTGVMVPDTVGKTLEWLLNVLPNVQRVYVPHDPNDTSGVQSLQSLTEAAQALGVELVVNEGSTPEELDSITSTIPENIDAVYVLRSGSIGPYSDNLVLAANEREIPVVSPNMSSLNDYGTLLSFGTVNFDMGYQAARMVDMILQGASPAAVPVENAEAYLGINLQAAEIIGITIPDEILSGAQEIVRPTP